MKPSEWAELLEAELREHPPDRHAEFIYVRIRQAMADAERRLKVRILERIKIYDPRPNPESQELYIKISRLSEAGDRGRDWPKAGSNNSKSENNNTEIQP